MAELPGFLAKIQAERDAKAREEALARRIAAHRRARDEGRVAILPAAQMLASGTVEPLVQEIKRALARHLSMPGGTAGRGHAALPILQELDDLDGPAVAAVKASIEHGCNLRANPGYGPTCNVIAQEIEKEARAQRIAKRFPLLLSSLRRRGDSILDLTDRKVMADMGIHWNAWPLEVRHQVGALFVDALCRIGLLELVHENVSTRAGWRKAWRVQLTQDACNVLMKEDRWQPTTVPLRLLPALDWSRMPPLRRRGSDEYDAAGECPRLVRAINRLQGVPLLLVPPVLFTAIELWEAGGSEELYGCTRVPPPIPPRPPDDSAPDLITQYRREVFFAHHDRRRFAKQRLAITRLLREAATTYAVAKRVAEQAGLSEAQSAVFQGWRADWRGRLYANHGKLSTQGGQMAKAMLSFEPQRLTDQGRGWLLKAAGSHYLGGRASWAEREAWAIENMPRHEAVGNAPPETVDLWRSADEPWLYMAAALEWNAQKGNGGRAAGVVRLDQTCSGPGILAGLMREPELARLTNLTGSERHDLYGRVANCVMEQMRHDLDDPRKRKRAEWWLQRIDRGSVKRSVLAMPYGSTFEQALGAFCGLADELQGGVRVTWWTRLVLHRGLYAATVVWRESRRILAPLFAFNGWLHKCAKEVVLRNEQRLIYELPDGLLVDLTQHHDARKQFSSWCWGRCISSTGIEPGDGPPSHRLTAQRAMPNLIHALDAYFCRQVICRMDRHIVTTHDCFACHPNDASKMQEVLLSEARKLLWANRLTEIHESFERHSGVALPPPPPTGALDPAQVGENPHLFC